MNVQYVACSSQGRANVPMALIDMQAQNAYHKISNPAEDSESGLPVFAIVQRQPQLSI